jgi:general stress protein 26
LQRVVKLQKEESHFVHDLRVKPKCTILIVERHQTKEFVKQEGDGNVRHEYDLDENQRKN